MVLNPGMSQNLRAIFVFSLIFSFLFFSEMAMAEESPKIEVNAGVVLDMNKRIGKMGLICINMALSDFYASHHHFKTRLVLHTRDSKDDVIAAAAAALDLVKNVQVEAIIIGLSSSMQAKFVIDLGNKTEVPVISFSATSVLFPPTQNPYFMRVAHEDTAQVNAISSIVQAFGWRQVIQIYEANDLAECIILSLANAFQSIGTHVPYRSVIAQRVTPDQIVAELYKLKTLQTKVFIVHTKPAMASLIFTKAKEVGMMEEGYAWIVTDAVANSLSSMEPSVIDSMQGVLGVRAHVPITNQLRNITDRWRTEYQQQYPAELNANLEVFGLWAYDAATALAMAVEKISASHSPFQWPNNSTNSPTDLDTIGVSQNGPKLRQALLNSNFTGLSGQFHLPDGQLQSSAYQIVNIFGNEVTVGFWTADIGLSRQLVASHKSSYSTYKENLRPIVWPGDVTSPPKGWGIPGEGQKLRIGVPVKDGFSEFVEIIRNPETNLITFGGYCIDVFDAVMSNLSYYVPYEYVAYATPDGKSKGTYNDLVNEVFLGELDAAVGDITISADMSQYVDFTPPFTEPGVSMVVKIKHDKSRNLWIFLKPLSWELWATIFCSFAFIGFVVWVLEHRINEDFRGPPSRQVGTVFWFFFSTMVFAHREKVLSNLARFVIVVWCFVVLVLTQSYTAYYTSMLTLQQLQPYFTDINDLKRSGKNVGYKGSLVFDILKQMGFDTSRLKEFSSSDELDSLFSSGHDSIAAAFGEVPYMNLFVAKYCSKYAMVESMHNTAGFGFAFSMGSPLLHDISMALLNMTERGQLTEIEKRWFRESSCSMLSTSGSTRSLHLENFWGLFLIAGMASVSALAIHTIRFLHEHRQVLCSSDPNVSIWRKIVALAKHFDKKDPSSHNIRKYEVPDKTGVEITQGAGSSRASPTVLLSLQTSPQTNYLSSPSSGRDGQTEEQMGVEIEIMDTPRSSGEFKNETTEQIWNDRAAEISVPAVV